MKQLQILIADQADLESQIEQLSRGGFSELEEKLKNVAAELDRKQELEARTLDVLSKKHAHFGQGLAFLIFREEIEDISKRNQAQLQNRGSYFLLGFFF